VIEDSLSVKSIKQYYIETSKFDRLNILLALLAQKKPSLALIFTRTKMGAERLNEILRDRGFCSMALHGDMSQNKRDQSMEAFRKAHINILVATDLASRGLDVTDVSHVINYDTTDDPMTYVHRIGRTGRMGKGGEAISFIFFDQTGLITLIEKVTDSKLEPLKVEFKPEDLPKRVHFSGQGSSSFRSTRAGGFSGSRGGERRSFGSRGHEGARQRGGRGPERREGRRDDKHRHLAPSKEMHSTRGGHSYMGRRN